MRLSNKILTRVTIIFLILLLMLCISARVMSGTFLRYYFDRMTRTMDSSVRDYPLNNFDSIFVSGHWSLVRIIEGASYKISASYDNRYEPKVFVRDRVLYVDPGYKNDPYLHSTITITTPSIAELIGYGKSYIYLSLKSDDVSISLYDQTQLKYFSITGVNSRIIAKDETRVKILAVLDNLSIELHDSSRAVCSGSNINLISGVLEDSSRLTYDFTNQSVSPNLIVKDNARLIRRAVFQINFFEDQEKGR